MKTISNLSLHLIQLILLDQHSSIDSSAMRLLLPSILLSFIFAVHSNEFCSEENLFLLTTNRTISQLNFQDQSSMLIYETPTNASIRSAQFHPSKKILVLLLQHSNQSSSLLTLQSTPSWHEISHHWFNSTDLFFSLTERNLYLLHSKSKRMEIFSIPIFNKVRREFHLENSPTQSELIDFILDEDLRFLWMLFGTTPHSLYLCQLDPPHTCRFFVNLMELEEPIRILLDRTSEQFFITSRRFLFTFEYSSSQTNYSLHYLNSTEKDLHYFYSICPRTAQLIPITMRSEQICTDRCVSLPKWIEKTESINHLIPLGRSSRSNSCAKQNVILLILVGLLILLNLMALLGFVLWSARRYFSAKKLSADDHSITNGSVYVVEKNVITQF